MGMFDWLKCEYSLPGTPLEIDKDPDFQTKDLENCLNKYVITSSGELQEEGKPVLHTGTIEFYSSNIVRTGPGSYTENGEDEESSEYTATFHNGLLQSIEQTSYHREVSLSSKDAPKPFISTKEEQDKRKARIAESLLGKEICILWGGSNQVLYKGTVIAEDLRSIVVKLNEKKYCKGFEILDRVFRDCTFFDSEEEALQNRKEHEDKWNNEAKAYEQQIAMKKQSKLAKV